MASRTECKRYIRDILNEPYDWAGGYAKYIVLSDGEGLCKDCIRPNIREILSASRDPRDHSGWQPAGVEVNWEDESLLCVHCYQPIECAYPND